MSAFRVLVMTHLKLFLRNRQTIVWSLVFPLALMILLGLFFGTPGETRTVVAVGGRSPYLTPLLTTLGHVPGFVVHRTGSVATAVAAVRGGQATLALWVSGIEPGRLTLWQSLANASSNGQDALLVEQVASEVQAVLWHTPSLFQVTVHSVSGTPASYIDFLVPGIVAMEITANGIFSGLALVTYREQGVLRRIRATPVPTALFLAARIVVQLLVLASQVTVTLVVAASLFAYRPTGAVLPAALVMLLGALAFISVGLFVAGIAQSLDAAAAIGNLINLPMLFLGGVFFPTDGLGGAFGFLVKIVPLTYLSGALRMTLSNGNGLGAVTGDLLFLAMTLCVATALAVRFFRWEKAVGEGL